jgi:hypothetical protein
LLLCASPDHRVRVVPASLGARAGTCGPFTWAAHQAHNPVIYVEHLTTSLFLEGRDDRSAYRRELDRLSDLALNETQSGEFLVNLASEYEQALGDHV